MHVTFRVVLVSVLSIYFIGLGKYKVDLEYFVMHGACLII